MLMHSKIGIVSSDLLELKQLYREIIFHRHHRSRDNIEPLLPSLELKPHSIYGLVVLLDWVDWGSWIFKILHRVLKHFIIYEIYSNDTEKFLLTNENCTEFLTKYLSGSSILSTLLEDNIFMLLHNSANIWKIDFEFNQVTDHQELYLKLQTATNSYYPTVHYSDAISNIVNKIGAYPKKVEGIINIQEYVTPIHIIKNLINRFSTYLTEEELHKLTKYCNEYDRLSSTE